MAYTQDDNNESGWTLLRVLQVLTLIPCWALLAAVISNYNSHGQITPSSIQFLFATAIILSVWSFCLLITFLRARNTALWMTFFDILGMIFLIAAVVWLSNIANVKCMADYTVVAWTSYQNGTTTYFNPYSTDPSTKVYPGSRLLRRLVTDLTPYTTPLTKRLTYVDANGNVVNLPLYFSHCSLIKAAWALAIINIILFFFSAILSLVIYQQYNQRRVVRKKVFVEPSARRPSVGMSQPPPVYMTETRRHSRRASEGGRSEGRHYHSRRGSRAGSDFYV